MARDGNGNYNLPEAPFVFDTVIDQDAVNNNFSDIGGALTQSIAKDGQTVPTADLPMGGQRHTGVGNATARSEYATAGQAQDSAFQWAGTAGGTANALALTPTPAITAYAAGQAFRFVAGSNANAGATTVAISGLTATDVQLAGAALAGGEIQAGRLYQIVYNGTAFQLDQSLSGNLSPLRGYISGLEMSNGTDTDHDLNVAVGVCTADDGSTSIRLTSALSNVPLDATFSEGAGGGMVSGDSLPTSGTVHLFLIDGSGKTPKLLGSSSAGSGLSPTLPTGFTVKRRIGSLRTQGSANFLEFLQSGDLFRYVTPITDADALSIGDLFRSDVSLSVPTQVETLAAINATCKRNGAVARVLITALDEAESSVSIPRISLTSETSGGFAAGQFQIKTDTSGQIGARADTSSTDFYVLTTGWVDLSR